MKIVAESKVAGVWIFTANVSVCLQVLIITKIGDRNAILDSKREGKWIMDVDAQGTATEPSLLTLGIPGPWIFLS